MAECLQDLCDLAVPAEILSEIMDLEVVVGTAETLRIDIVSLIGMEVVVATATAVEALCHAIVPVVVSLLVHPARRLPRCLLLPCTVPRRRFAGPGSRRR